MLRNEIFKIDELNAEDRAIWISLIESGPLHSPLLHPDFVQHVAKCRRDVRIIKSQDAHGKRAFLAIHKRPFGVARPIGATFSDYHALIAEPGFSGGLETSLADTGIHAFHYFNLIESGASDARGWWAECGPQKCPRDAFANSHPKRAKQLRRLGRKLAKEQGDATLIIDDKRQTTLDALREWKADQFKASGRHNVLGATWVRHLLDRLQDGARRDIAGFMVSLNIDGHPIAAEFGPRWGEVFHPWLAAYNPDYARYSPGHLLVHDFLGRMEEAGLSRYDFGAGDEAHKTMFSNSSIGLNSGRAYAAKSRLSTRFLIPGAGGLRGKIIRRWEQILLSETQSLSRAAGALSAARLVLRQNGGR